ncbi:hypothetical protein [Niallia oryzisoli]|uniref:hypothetical protein n=1 Tax=Niallia oryzisoli TaxID=1737571 RepID=UPI003734F949
MVNLIRVGLLTISWLSLVFLPKRSFRKYLPVANLAVGLILLTSLFSLPFKLWIVEKGGIKEKIYTDLSLILGPFFSGTLWIFHLTYGRFGAYLLLNMIMNFLLAFPLCTIFQKLKLFKLVHFRPIHIFVTYIFYSIMLYGYQMFLTKPKKMLSKRKIRRSIF